MNSLPWFQNFAPQFSALLLETAVRSAGLLLLALVAMRGLRRCSASTRHLTLLLMVGSLGIVPSLSWTLPRLAVLPPALGLRAFATTVGDDATRALTPAPTHVARERSSPRTKNDLTSVTTPASAVAAPTMERGFAMGRV